MRGANAAVVGILGLALYNPIWTNGVHTPRDFALAVGGFLLLTVWKAAPWVVVLLLAAARRIFEATDTRMKYPGMPNTWTPPTKF